MLTTSRNHRIYKLLALLILLSFLSYSFNFFIWKRGGDDDDHGSFFNLLPIDRVLTNTLKPLSKDSIKLDARLFGKDPIIKYERVGARTRRKVKRVKGVGELIPDVKVKAVNCNLLFQGDSFENIRAEKYHAQHTIPPSLLSNFSNLLSTDKGCETFLKSRRYIDQALNHEEASFPLAYSLVVYKDFLQFERLLRTIYRPQNFYCIHVDSKSDQHFKALVLKLTACFPGGRVFVAPRSFDVQWAKFTVLQTEVLCMEELWRRFAVEEIKVTITPRQHSQQQHSQQQHSQQQHSQQQQPNPRPVTTVTKKRPRWKYFINLTGQEFPLRTNWEIVRILKIFDGANNLEGTTNRMHEILKDYYIQNKPFRGIVIHKGSVHVVLSRAFVDFTLHHPLPSSLLTSLRYAYIPDEYFFSTLNYNPLFKIPGSFTGNVTESDPINNRFIARFKNWGYKPFAWPCEGRWVRQICNFGVGDLPLLSSRDELFANKFDSHYEPLGYDCMEEALFEKIRAEYDEEYNGVKLKEIFSPIITLTTPSPLPPNFNRTNPDHKKLPGVDFSSYGDIEDGTFAYGSTSIKLTNYLKFVRPHFHRPLHVDHSHYHNLSFVRNHYRVDDNWVYLYDDGFELSVNDKYNQTQHSYLETSSNSEGVSNSVG